MQDEDLDNLLEQRDLIDDLNRSAAAEKIPVIGKNTGYFLEFAVRSKKPNNILEIGCGNGFSSYFIIRGMEKDSRYTGIDMNRKRLAAAEIFISSRFPEADYRLLCGNALKIVPGLNEVFDLVFIDAAKFEYPLYLEVLVSRIKKGSIVIADDILYGNKIFLKNPGKHFRNSIKGLKGYLRSTGPGSRFDTFLADIDDGLAVSIYKGKE